MPMQRLRAELGAATAGPGGALAADRLCRVCVELLQVDGAALSLVHGDRGTVGSSGALSRRLDEFQFTFGEGPCLDSVREGAPVLVPDLQDPAERRWPAFRGAVRGAGLAAVFAIPVAVASSYVGALDLYRQDRGRLDARTLAGGMWAAQLAALPLLDVLGEPVEQGGPGTDEDAWDQLAALERVEVYQATGMVMESLDLDPAEALVRLRAYAATAGRTPSEIALALVERRLVVDDAGWRRTAAGPPSADP